MLIKSYFLDPHLEFFPGNLDVASVEHVGNVHQDISGMDMKYRGKWSPDMLADHWGILKS